MEKEKFDTLRERLLAEKEYREEHWMDRWNNLKPFNDVDDIPDVPIVKNPEDYEKYVVQNLIRCGAIPKDQLEVGAEYEGSCRNATRATWNGKKFEYKRYKLGFWMDDAVNHFQDDDGYDVFVPIRKVDHGRNTFINQWKMIYNLLANIKTLMDATYQDNGGKMTKQHVDDIVEYIHMSIDNILEK